MGGQVTAHAEVTGRAHQAFAEKLLPNAVHHDAGGDRIALAGDGLRQLQTPGAVVKTGAAWDQDRRKATSDAIAQVILVAPDKDVGRLQRGPILRTQDD